MEIVFPYIGVGLHEYRVMAKKSLDSARKVMPGAKTVLLTDNHTPILEGQYDKVLRVPMAIGSSKMALGRGLLQASYARSIKEDAVFCDLDVIAHAPYDKLFEDKDFTLKLFARDNKPDQPYIGAFFACRPTISTAFWDKYIEGLQQLAANVRADWWIDQLMLSILVGHKNVGDKTDILGQRVAVENMAQYIPVPTRDDSLPYTPDMLAVHYKGNRKSLM